MGRARGQCAASTDRGDAGGGKFCRGRHVLPGLAGTLRGNSTFIGIFVMARHLLD
jgi:hypothetical protein